MIDVVGLGARGWSDLPERERAVVAAADLVVGGARLLRVVPAFAHQRRAELPSPLRAGLPGVLAGAARPVVLASGDPLLSGIGSTLIEMFGSEAVRVHPGVSSVALARARMGWSAEGSDVISVVGRPVHRLRRALHPRARLVVLSGTAAVPDQAARLLVEAGYPASRMTVLADLGADAESRIDEHAERWAAPAVPDLHVLCIECDLAPGAPVLGWTAGLPDEAYEHDGQLTKRDIRAAVLARLAPRPGEYLWDLGAGAGSIAIEWCRADPRCRAVAVERDPARAERIGRNAARLGVPEVEVRTADAATVLPDLATPGAVFLGGGLTADLLARCWERLPSGGRLAATGVTVETEQVLLDSLDRWGGDLVRLSVEMVEPLGRYRSWNPSRPVVLWGSVKDGSR